MPYTAEISRTNPTCFLFLVDQSASMLEPFGGQADKPKAQGVADALNRLLQNIVLKSTKADGVRDFFYIGLIAYGGKVTSSWSGTLAGQTLVPVSLLANNPLRVEQRSRMTDDGAGGLAEQKFKFPVWFEAHPTGKTPMCKALTIAQRYLEVFLAKHPTCYPPLVINITDGAPSDGDPRPAAQTLQKLASQDGNVLLFNVHISSQQARPVEYPDSEAGLVDKYARLLFRMSSPLPDRLFQAALAEGYPLQPGARGFVFNADLVSVIRFLDIGTRVSQTVR